MKTEIEQLEEEILALLERIYIQSIMCIDALEIDTNYLLIPMISTKDWLKEKYGDMGQRMIEIFVGEKNDK